MGPYKVLTAEFADLMLGYYGHNIGEYDPQVVAKAKEQTGKEPIEQRPADLSPAEFDTLKKEAAALDGFNGTDEDVLTYAMFPKVAPGFFKTRPEGPKSVAKDPAELEAEKLAALGDGKSGPVRTPIKYLSLIHI